MFSQKDTDTIRIKYKVLKIKFDERSHLILAITEAKTLDYGDVPGKCQ